MIPDILGLRLQQIRQALFAVYGVVVSLLVIVAFGDLYAFYGDAPAGWFTLWLLTTVAAIPMGIFLLAGTTWKPIPLRERRGLGMAYLLAGCTNFFSLALFIQIQSYEPVFFCVPVAYALVLFVVYLRVYTMSDRVREETFP